MWNVIAYMKYNWLFLVSNRLQSTIWCFEGMKRISSRIFQRPSRSHKITCDDGKVEQEVAAHLWSLLVSQPTPDYSHCQAHCQEAFAQRFLCLTFFLLYAFPLSCSICHFQLSFGLDLIPTTIHKWNIKWVDYKMNWKLASISSIALRISWLCFVSANFLSVGSSTTDLGPTPGSFGW